MTRRALLKAAETVRDGGTPPGFDPAVQRVRSVSIELPRDRDFRTGAQHGLFAPLGTDPVTV